MKDQTDALRQVSVRLGALVGDLLAERAEKLQDPDVVAHNAACQAKAVELHIEQKRAAGSPQAAREVPFPAIIGRREAHLPSDAAWHVDIIASAVESLEAMRGQITVD